MPLLQRLQVLINRAFWPALAMVLVIFVLFELPYIRERQAAYAAAETIEISAENDLYCRRFKFVPGSDGYQSCVDDLQTLRASVQRKKERDFNF